MFIIILTFFSEEIPIVFDATLIFLALRPLFCEPEAIVTDAGAYLFNEADLVAKAKTFVSEAQTLSHRVGDISTSSVHHGVLFFTEHLPRRKADRRDIGCKALNLETWQENGVW